MARRNWCFTLNNPPDVLGKADFPPGLRYCIYQRESGERNTEHFQGYVEFDKPVRLSAFKKCTHMARAHLEVRKGDREQARDYCRKADTRVKDPVEIGVWKSQGQGNRSDWDLVKEDVKAKKPLSELTETWFSKMVMYGQGIIRASSFMRPPRSERTRVIIFYGEPGCGKTTLASELYPGAYWKSARNKWFDGYNGEDVVICDEFSGGWFEFDLWKRLGDASPLQLEVKGGFIQFTAKTVVYISNFHPRLWYSHLFRDRPDQLKALARRVDLVQVWDEPFVHREVEDSKQWCLEGGPANIPSLNEEYLE